MIYVWDNGGQYSDHGDYFIDVRDEKDWDVIERLLKVDREEGKLIFVAPEVKWYENGSTTIGDMIGPYNFFARHDKKSGAAKYPDAKADASKWEWHNGYDEKDKWFKALIPRTVVMLLEVWDKPGYYSTFGEGKDALFIQAFKAECKERELL